MASTAARASDATEDLAMMAGAAVLGSLTIPGRPEHVREARAFVAKSLGELHPSRDDAILLTSELVTNSVMHSSSRIHGGTITLVLMDAGGGLRI
jgi:anti-sigma regulatory factor (Ser/Thr protein kinase)